MSRTEFTNWAGLVRSRDCEVRSVSTIDEVRAAIAAARARRCTLRVAGTTHSHAPLVQADGGIIALTDGLSGMPLVDRGSAVARIPAGTKLAAVGAPLWQAGYSLANQGDVDVQSIAGLIGTGVHGTGPSLPSISASVCGARLVVADGSCVDTDDDRDLLEAARLNLGLLGVVTEVRLRVIPAYHLHARDWSEPIAPVMERLDDLIHEARHFLFFWEPRTDEARCKQLHPAPGPVAAGVDGPGERTDPAYRVFPGDCGTPHTEMEYSVPAEEGPACFWRIRALMRERFPDVERPVEYRTVAGDDGWISPARGRATVAISIHESSDRPHEAFFRTAERIFREHRGRPHWGKVHYLDAASLAAEHPETWDRFWAVRARYDPEGRFLNPHLRAVGGV
ncbi:MAG: FAD-binding protein [Ectothiorhodospiraceae bacterium]|nr:FAD-binding protein [Ectothiorhodospiraceae bacterium]